MARIRVGVAGCGSVGGHAYLPDLAASPHVELVAVCDVDPERARRVAERHAVPAWYTDVDVMLARSDFALLLNPTPMRQHAPLNLRALRAGRLRFLMECAAQCAGGWITMDTKQGGDRLALSRWFYRIIACM